MNQPTQGTATPFTSEANSAVAASLSADRTDFELATRGLLRTLTPPQILGAQGNVVWDLEQFAFLDAEPPPEANPSLWRQAQLNRNHGLFEVVEGIYQVRGYDLSNITFVRSEHGWIVIDPLTVQETAAAAVRLVNEEFGELPIRAVIYTHSHVDHYGGIRGVVTEEQVRDGSVQLIAPEGFLGAAISENVLVGPAMSRRAMYMYGVLLPVGSHGHLDAGLGKGIPRGTNGLIAPNYEVTHTGETLVVDGIEIEFQMTPGTEAPAEMNFYFPQFRALCMAENCSATLHNVYTPRGAEIRDALAWSRYIQEALESFLDRTDVAFASHHWPRWGQDAIEHYLGSQRDAYRYLHDETLRLANHGFVSTEIAEQVELPSQLRDEFFNRDYYGTVNHNCKAVYQRYLGWFDANPAHLHPLPPVEASTKLVEYMGGSEAVLQRAHADFDRGDYRWVAQIVNAVVFADPSNQQARDLQAAALEQLGFQAESGPWRSFYLTGALELRNGTPNAPGLRSTTNTDVLAAMTPQMVLDNCAMKLNGPLAADANLEIDIAFAGLGESDGDHLIRVWVTRGVLQYGDPDHATARRGPAAVSVRSTIRAFLAVTSETSTVAEEVERHTMSFEGDQSVFESFVGLLDQFDLFFPIIEP